MKTTMSLPRAQIEALRPRDVQHYLTSRGWVTDPVESSTKAAVFQHPTSTDAEVVVPLRRDLGDYTSRMADVVQTLSAFENRPIWEVLQDLSTPPSDILRLRVIAPEATLGSLPLDEGIQLLRGGRDALLASACSVKRPLAFHPQKTLKDADAFIRGCKLGQTERGSFVATIIAPVPPEIQSLSSASEGIQDAGEPFARRVTTRLMASLGIVSEAVQTERMDPIFDGIYEGVSANLCDALGQMRPPGDQSRLEIRMSWARSRPRLPTGIPQVVSFDRADFPTIEEAGRHLRERAVPRRERFVGKVIGLQSEVPTLFGDTGGKIVLRTQVGGQPARIKVVLQREDYRMACDAHRDELRVAVTGMIHHDVKIRVYELSQPEGFQVLSE